MSKMGDVFPILKNRDVTRLKGLLTSIEGKSKLLFDVRVNLDVNPTSRPRDFAECIWERRSFYSSLVLAALHT